MIGTYIVPPDGARRGVPMTVGMGLSAVLWRRPIRVPDMRGARSGTLCPSLSRGPLDEADPWGLGKQKFAACAYHLARVLLPATVAPMDSVVGNHRGLRRHGGHEWSGPAQADSSALVAVMRLTAPIAEKAADYARRRGSPASTTTPTYRPRIQKLTRSTSTPRRTPTSTTRSE